MLPKKNPDIEVGRNSSLYFAIGLNIMLFFSWYGINYKSYDNELTALNIMHIDSEIEEDIPITNFEAPPPPPAPPAAAPDIITVVEDAIDVEETLIESTETSQLEEIQEYNVSLEDLSVDEVEEDIQVPFAVIETVPIFPGCKGKNNQELKKCFEEKIQLHIRKNLKYPEVALDMGIEGKVFVIFIIDKEGNVTNIRTRGPDTNLEKESARIMSVLPKMTPGKQRGKPVKVTFSIPINFKVMDN